MPGKFPLSVVTARSAMLRSTPETGGESAAFSAQAEATDGRKPAVELLGLTHPIAVNAPVESIFKMGLTLLEPTTKKSSSVEGPSPKDLPAGETTVRLP